MLHLSCASTHLTAFWGAAGGAAARFSVNSVRPIDDAGDMKVMTIVDVARKASSTLLFGEGEYLTSTLLSNSPLCILALPWLANILDRRPQMVLDVSNMRPVIGLLLVGCCLGAFAYFSRGMGAQEAAALRRQVFLRKGSLVPEVGVRDAPQDVRRMSLAQVRRSAGQQASRPEDCGDGIVRDRGDRRASINTANESNRCASWIELNKLLPGPAWLTVLLHQPLPFHHHSPNPSVRAVYRVCTVQVPWCLELLTGLSPFPRVVCVVARFSLQRRAGPHRADHCLFR